MGNKRNNYYSSGSESRYRPAGEKTTAESATDALKPRDITYKSTDRSDSEDQTHLEREVRINQQKLAIIDVLKISNKPLSLSELHGLVIKYIPEKQSLNSLLQTLIYQKQIHAEPLPSGKSNPIRRNHVYSLPTAAKNIENE